MRADEPDDAPPPFRRSSWAHTAGVATALAALVWWSGPLIDAGLRDALDPRVSERGVTEFAALCALLTLLFRTRTVPPRAWGDRDGDAIVVRVSPLRRLAWSGVVFLFALAPLLELRVRRAVGPLEVAALAGAAAGALALLDRFFARAVRLTPSGIEQVSAWTGRRRLVPWEAIGAIADDGVAGSLRIRAEDGVALEIPLVSDGLGDLARMTLARAPARATRAVEGMHDLLAAWSAELDRAGRGSVA